MQLLKNPNFSFMKSRKLFYLVSIIVILVGLISIIIHKGNKYNIDFTGGLSMEIAPRPVNGEYMTVSQIRDSLQRNGFIDVEIQELFRTNSFLVKVKSEGGAGDKIIETLQSDFPEQTNYEGFIRSQEEVGPRAGADLRASGLKAIFISLFLVLIYIWIRYRFTWGFIAALGLLHDITITLGILSLTGKEIGMTILAALLTVVGYSINNTIVIFDRIRSNLKLYRKEDDAQVIDRSINETLNRTIMMTFTTLIVNLSLMIFGGPVIYDFAFTFFVGIIAGTYSSMLLVTGVVLDSVLAIKKHKNLTKSK